MNRRSAKEPLRLLVRWTRRVLLAGGVSLLAYCAYVLVDTWSFQRAADRQFAHLLTVRYEAGGGIASPGVLSSGLIGRIEIPRLGISAILMEGTTDKTLRRAVGHIKGTALPGQPGNVGLSGHRDTFFRPLRNVRAGDIIALATLPAEYRYRVVSIKVVRPDDVAVLAAGHDECLTLITCYPFYFVGPAPYRFVVRAERAE